MLIFLVFSILQINICDLGQSTKNLTSQNYPAIRYIIITYHIMGNFHETKFHRSMAQKMKIHR